MKKLLISAIMAVASFASSAGVVQPANVVIDTDNRSAQGDMVTARFSDNENELIGCGQRTLLTGGEPISWAFCQARTTEDDLIICFTQDENLLKQMRTINSYSFVTFRWDENGDCSYVGFSTQSMYIPNQKLTKHP